MNFFQHLHDAHKNMSLSHHNRSVDITQANLYYLIKKLITTEQITLPTMPL